MSQESGPHVAMIYRYPVKSMRGERIDATQVYWHGLAGDRRFAFVRGGNTSRFPWLTGREVPNLLRYAPYFVESANPGASQVRVITPDGADHALEDDALRDDRDVNVVVLALVGEDRELFLADEAGEAIGRGDVPGGQACEARRVDLPDFSVARNLLTVLVDEEDELGIRVAAQPADDRFDLLILLVIHHHGTVHGRCSLGWAITG